MINEIEKFVSQLRVRSVDNPMAKRWCYGVETLTRDIRNKVLRLVIYSNIVDENMVEALAELIIKVLPVELSKSPYGLIDSTREGLEFFVKTLLASGKPGRIVAATKILTMLQGYKDARQDN